MKARLFRAGSDRGTPFEFAESASIGRGKGNTIRLDSDAVSTEHAKVWFDADLGGYRIEDLGSLNGTKLDGVRLTRAEPLDRLQVVEFGGDGLEFVLQVVDVEATPAAQPAPASSEPEAGTTPDQEMPELPEALHGEEAATAAEAPATGTAVDQEMPDLPAALIDPEDSAETLPAPVKEPSAPPPAPELGARTEGEAPYYLQMHEPADSEPFPLMPGNRVVGRARSADVTIVDPAVSRRHALFTVEAGKVTLQDLGSRNQTFVNDRLIEEATEVKPGDVVRFGELGATLQEGAGDDG